METAEKQVTDVVKMDIHLDYTADGKRYIARVSEIIQLDEGVPYPEYDPNNPDDSMAAITREYYTRRTDRQSFTTRLIMHYDLATHTYIADNRLSKELEERLRNNLPEDIRVEFDKFMLENWGPRNDEVDEIITAELVEQQLADLDAQVEAIKEKQAKELSAEQNKLFQIEQDNIARAQWKQGYVDSQSAAQPQFTVGSFFNDSDYQ